MDKKRTSKKKKVEMGKLIQFPMDKVFRKRKVNGPKISEEEAKFHKEETFIENLAEQMTVDIINDLKENAVAMESDAFLRDLAVTIEGIKSLLKRDFGHRHPMQDITDNLTKIVTMPDGKKYTDINYRNISVSAKTPPVVEEEIQQEVKDDTEEEFEIDFFPEDEE